MSLVISDLQILHHVVFKRLSFEMQKIAFQPVKDGF